jgi:hypothetical protein
MDAQTRRSTLGGSQSFCKAFHSNDLHPFTGVANRLEIRSKPCREAIINAGGRNSFPAFKEMKAVSEKLGLDWPQVTGWAKMPPASRFIDKDSGHVR